MTKVKLVKIGKIVLIVGTAFLLIGIIAFIAIQKHIKNEAKPYIMDIEQLPQSDAVLVLGALVYENSTPSPILEDRLKYAYEVYSKGIAKKIIVSGDHGTKQYNEVEVMKQYLLDMGVADEDIFMDHAGFDTYDSIYRAKEIFEVETLIISTQEFHMPRAIYIGTELGIKTYGYASPDKAIYKMKKNNIRESLARVKAFIDIELFDSKPKYSGEKISIKGDGRLTWD